MDRFVTEQNVSHYVDRLHSGTDAVTRSTLLKLLLEEENMLGPTREQLARTDWDIDKLRRIIERADMAACDTVDGPLTG